MISSRQNQKLKDIRRLRRCKEDRAVLEGPHLVGEAVATGIDLELVLATPELLATETGRYLAARLPVPFDVVDAKLLAEGADTDSPRGIVAVATLPRASLDALPVVDGGIYVFLDGIQDPGNLGAIARVAEAAGATALAIGPGSAHPNHPRALRGSAGSLLRLPAVRDVEPASLDTRLGPGTTWVALDAGGGLPLWDWRRSGTLVVALGGEGAGVGVKVRELEPTHLRIPMNGPVESLNVATATAVVLFELARRRGSDGSQA